MGQGLTSPRPLLQRLRGRHVPGRRPHASDGPIDAVLRRLASGIPFSRLSAADLLAEARDGLHDAADAYRRSGHNPTDAARLAVDDFGDPAELAADYATEVSTRTAGLTARVSIVSFLVMMAAWFAIGPIVHAQGEPNRSGWWPVFGTIAGAAVVVGLVTMWWFRRRSRRPAGSPGSAALVVTSLTLICSGATIVAGLANTVRAGATPPDAQSWKVAVEALSALAMLAVSAAAGWSLLISLSTRRPQRRA